MKVLQIIQQRQLRGAEIFATQLCGELRFLGVNCDVAYLFEGSHQLTANGITFIAVGARRDRRLADVNAYRRINQIVREGNYDIVQANAGDTLKYAAASKFMFGWKAKLVFRNANKMSAFIRNPVHRMFNSMLLSRCDHVISVSESCRTDIVSTFPHLDGKTTTITIGTYPVSRTRTTQPTEPVIINVASFVPEKNHLLLLDIFSQFRQRQKRGTLWLAGDGPQRGLIEARIAQLGLQEVVKLWGYKPEVGDLLTQSTLMVLPSAIEGLPAAILEAFANGVPVITSRVGGIPDVIDHGVNGLMVEGFLATDYVRYMEQLLLDETGRARIVENAMGTIKQKFDIRVIAGKFAKAYEELGR